MNASARSLTALVILATTSACLAGGDFESEPGQSGAEYDDAITELQDTFGDDTKADFLGRVTACKLLEPLAAYGERGLRSGYFVGIEGEAVLGVATGLGGVAVAFDLYHHQMTVLKYVGVGLTVPGLGASVKAYHGSVSGFESGVGEMAGFFVQAEVNPQLPFLNLSFDNYSVFASANDDNGNGLIGPSEIILPPNGIYGYTKGVELGFDLLPSGMVVSGSIVEGYRSHFKHAIRAYYEYFNAIPDVPGGEDHVFVRLVDANSGTECHPDWPKSDTERACVLEFGDPSWSHTKRGLTTAFALCAGTGSCALKLAWKRAIRAVAVGALRDAGGNIRTFCPNVEVGQELAEG